MPKFKTLTPIKIFEEITPEGDEIELSEKQAKTLLARGDIEPASRPIAEKEARAK